MKKCLAFLFLVFIAVSQSVLSQDSAVVKTDTISKFDAMNAKMEALFKVIPVPIVSYSKEAGSVFGLAKFNLLDFTNDSLTSPSRLSEVATFSTLGRINLSVSTDLYWHQDKYLVMGYINYKRQPEYIFGIGNDVSRDDVEQIEIDRVKFVNYGLVQVVKNLYVGLGADITDYTKIKTDSTSFLVTNNISGIEGGSSYGLGFSSAYDTRENKYNAQGGTFIILKAMTFPKSIGNPYVFSSVDLDVRKYYNPWLKHIIALQTTTSYRTGDVPFYELAKLGGENKMRGYYEGALRDKVLWDCQAEYRMPVWNIFGVTTWVGTGRVAKSYADLTFDNLWWSYGAGLRIRVDSKHNTNLRIDFGFGPGGVSGTYLNFAEAF
jgi:outer membrane protein assembly factor BamA